MNYSRITRGSFSYFDDRSKWIHHLPLDHSQDEDEEGTEMPEKCTGAELHLESLKKHWIRQGDVESVALINFYQWNEHTEYKWYFTRLILLDLKCRELKSAQSTYSVMSVISFSFVQSIIKDLITVHAVTKR